MTSTALITGTSTDIGRATVKHLAANRWNVVAAMRDPDAESARDDPLNALGGAYGPLESTSREKIVPSSRPT